MFAPKGLVMEQHAVVAGPEWVEARKALLAKEKEITRLGDELAQARRDLPWEAVSKGYWFEGPAGQVSLSDLFEGRSQLIVYHFGVQLRLRGPRFGRPRRHQRFFQE
jgi:predicted dithiol-disulfide oxidoreductase (DUF899 family)